MPLLGRLTMLGMHAKHATEKEIARYLCEASLTDHSIIVNRFTRLVIITAHLHLVLITDNCIFIKYHQ